MKICNLFRRLKDTECAGEEEEVGGGIDPEGERRESEGTVLKV